MGLDNWVRSRQERKHARHQNAARRKLQDAVHEYEKWSFADTPSRHEDRMENIYRLIRRYESLGGDVLKHGILPWRLDWLASKAMPETFERKRESDGYYKVHRKEEVHGESIPETDGGSTSSP